jgi:hypothetical protein
MGSSAEPAPRGAPPDGPGTPGTEVLYTPFRGLAGSPERAVVLVGYGLVLLQAVLRGWSKFGGWFLIDDLSFIGRSLNEAHWTASHLLEGWHGHLMPGAFALVNVLTDLAPWSYAPVAVVDLAGQALLSVLVLRLLTDLFGRRPAVLVPFTIFVLSPITLPAFLWWAASLNQLWGQIAMALILTAHLRYHRTGRLRWGLLGTAALVGGLAFSEKVVLMVPVVFLFSLLWFTPGRPRARLVLALRRSRAVWVSYAAVTVGYLALYVATARAPEKAASSLTIAVETLGTGVVRAVVPGIIGGPLTWAPIDTGGIADPADWLVVASILLVLLVMLFSVYRRARAVFGWLVVVGYVVVNAGLLGLSRATFTGPLIGAELRYHTDELLIIVVFGSLTLLPVVGTFAIGPFQRLVPRTPGSALGLDIPPEASRRVEVLVSGALAATVLVLSTLSTVRFDPLWRSNAGRDYFATVERDLGRADGPVTIAEVAVPPEVQYPLAFPLNLTTFLFAGLEPPPRFLRPGHPAEDVFYLPDEDGHLRVGRVDGYVGEPGPSPSCGYRVERDEVAIPLRGTTLNWVWTARIGYIASLDAEAVVTIGETSTPVPITAGAHTLYVVGQGAVDEVTISGLTYGSLCTDDVEVGFMSSTPGTSP